LLYWGLKRYTESISRRNKELRKLNTELNNEIKIRNEIEQELVKRETELKDSNIELKRSNQDLEQFAYIASHDLKEPLRTIGSMTELLELKLKDEMDESLAQYMGMIKQGVARMQSLISSLLTFAGVGSDNLNLTELDLNIIVEQNISALKLKIEESNAKIIVDPLPKIIGDVTQFGMLFHNLISNGIKFNKSECPMVKITQVRKKNRNFWWIAIEDNGIGINPEFRSKIFEIFKRLNTKDEFEGTGIGLALTKKIITSHGGTIEVDESSLGGTKFIISVHKRLK